MIGSRCRGGTKPIPLCSQQVAAYAVYGCMGYFGRGSQTCYCQRLTLEQTNTVHFHSCAVCVSQFKRPPPSEASLADRLRWQDSAPPIFERHPTGGSFGKPDPSVKSFSRTVGNWRSIARRQRYGRRPDSQNSVWPPRSTRPTKGQLPFVDRVLRGRRPLNWDTTVVLILHKHDLTSLPCLVTVAKL